MKNPIDFIHSRGNPYCIAICQECSWDSGAIQQPQMMWEAITRAKKHTNTENHDVFIEERNSDDELVQQLEVTPR